VLCWEIFLYHIFFCSTPYKVLRRRLLKDSPLNLNPSSLNPNCGWFVLQPGFLLMTSSQSTALFARNGLECCQLKDLHTHTSAHRKCKLFSAIHAFSSLAKESCVVNESRSNKHFQSLLQGIYCSHILYCVAQV
jgi:hypothetical protein